LFLFVGHFLEALHDGDQQEMLGAWPTWPKVPEEPEVGAAEQEALEEPEEPEVGVVEQEVRVAGEPNVEDEAGDQPQVT
jgi:hypothetical protein